MLEKTEAHKTQDENTHTTMTNKKTLEKTEGVIKNGQSRETGKIGNTRHKTKTSNEKNTKQNKAKSENKTQHRKPKRFITILRALLVIKYLFLFSNFQLRKIYRV